MAELITYTCGRKSYSHCLAQLAVPFVLLTVFTKFFILDVFGDIPAPYEALLICIWILSWLAVLLLGFLKRYLYRLTVEFHPGADSRIVERSFFRRSRTFDSTVQFFVINKAGSSPFIRSSDEWKFGRLLSKEQRLAIVGKLNSRSSQSA